MSDEQLATSDESQIESEPDQAEAVESPAEAPDQQTQELLLGKFETVDQLQNGYQELERAFHSS